MYKGKQKVYFRTSRKLRTLPRDVGDFGRLTTNTIWGSATQTDLGKLSAYDSRVVAAERPWRKS